MCGKSLQLKHHKCEKVCKIKNVWKKSTFYYVHRQKSTLQAHYRHTTGTLQAHSGTLQAHYRHTYTDY